MFEALKYFGVSDIAYNQPKSPPRTPGANHSPGHRGDIMNLGHLTPRCPAFVGL